jgi:hypothetical protein
MTSLHKRVVEALEHEAANAAENGFDDVAAGLRALAAELRDHAIVPVDTVDYSKRKSSGTTASRNKNRNKNANRSNSHDRPEA